MGFNRMWNTWNKRDAMRCNSLFIFYVNRRRCLFVCMQSIVWKCKICTISEFCLKFEFLLFVNCKLVYYVSICIVVWG